MCWPCSVSSHNSFFLFTFLPPRFFGASLKGWSPLIQERSQPDPVPPLPLLANKAVATKIQSTRSREEMPMQPDSSPVTRQRHTGRELWQAIRLMTTQSKWSTFYSTWAKVISDDDYVNHLLLHELYQSGLVKQNMVKTPNHCTAWKCRGYIPIIWAGHRDV